jgi:hypothetical protein
MSDPASWYIVKQENGQCKILSAAPESLPDNPAQAPPAWGPYASQSEAIARRVGLIRAGKCQPM